MFSSTYAITGYKTPSKPDINHSGPQASEGSTDIRIEVFMEPKKYFRIRRPNKDRRKWSIETKATGRWLPVPNEEIDTINDLYLGGTLDVPQSLERMKRVLTTLYEWRDRAKRQSVEPGNQKILEEFLEKTYTPQKQLRMGRLSLEAAEGMLTRALLDIGDLPVDGDNNALQKSIDDQYKNRPGSHIKRITALNRIRKFLAKSYLLHLNGQSHDVRYMSESQLLAMLNHIEDPTTRILAGFLFYTGLRTGEAFAVTPQTIRQHNGATLVIVTRQMWRDGSLGPTKTKSNRKAFVIPGGEKFVEDWAAIEDKLSIRLAPHNKRIKRAAKKVGVKDFYAHCLRHSYCVHLIGKGCTIDWVAQSAGHSRAVCERYYSTHSLTNDAVTMMHSILSKKTG